MNNTSRTSIIILVLGILVLAGAGYMLFFKGDTNSAVTEDGEPGSEVETQFLALTSEIDAITFNTAIFADPRFDALVDIRTEILPETKGRPDPFAPLSGLPAANE